MSLRLLALIALEALSSGLPVRLEVGLGRSISCGLLVQSIDDALRGCDTDHFLLHLVICFDGHVFKDFLPNTLGKTLKELLHCVVVHWVVTSFVSDAFEFRDILIYLWPSHLQCL